MKLARRTFLRLAVGVVALPAVSHIARAQTYPTRPITIVAPFEAGGPTDAIGRLLAQQMRSSLGQTVIVENVTGAGGTIGVARAARAAPDGYTISLGQNGSHVVTGATYTNLAYDLLSDFEPLALISIAPFVIVAKKTMPAGDLTSLIAWLKANPGTVSVGNAGSGSISHVCGLLFQEATGTRVQFVPYRGTAPAMQDLVAGQIDLMISDPVTSIPQVRGGTINPEAWSPPVARPIWRARRVHARRYRTEPTSARQTGSPTTTNGYRVRCVKGCHRQCHCVKAAAPNGAVGNGRPQEICFGGLAPPIADFCNKICQSGH